MFENYRAEVAIRDSRTSEELVEAARIADEDAAWGLVTILQARGGERELELGIELSRSTAADDRCLAADILGQLGWADRTFLDESVSRLIELLEDDNSDVLYCAGVALGHRRDERAISPLLGLVRHPDVDVRLGVVSGLSGHDDERAVAALIELSRDENIEIRDWATFGFGSLSELDSPEIRDALMARVNDEDEVVRGEALAGLVQRQDIRCYELVCRELENGFAGPLVLEAAEVLRETTLYPLLKKSQALVPNDDPNHLRYLARALAACSGVKDSELLTAELVEATLQDNFPAQNDSWKTDYVEELAELVAFKIETVGQLRELLSSHLGRILEIDRTAMESDPVYRAVNVRDLGEEYVIEHEQRGCWYALPGLLRKALELEFGDAYEAFADQRDRDDLELNGESLLEEELFAILQNPAPPATLDQIEQFELIIGCKLPAEYRHFLRRCNGGSLPSDWDFEFRSTSLPAGSREVKLLNLGGLRDEPALSLNHQRARFAGSLPDDLLWVGDDGNDNAICIGLRGLTADRIYFWDSERAAGGQKEAATLIAPSFLQFLIRFKRKGS